MRKMYLLLAVMIALSSSLIAQNARTAANKPATRTSGSNSNRPISPLTRSLVTQLSLNPDQQAKTNNAIYSYIVQRKKGSVQNKGEGAQKSKAPGLQKNKDENLQKNNGQNTAVSNSFINDLNNELKTIFTGTQYSKFLSLKPKTNDPANPLSFLFY